MKIDNDILKKLLTEGNFNVDIKCSVCHKENFLSWNKLEMAELEKMKKIGEINSEIIDGIALTYDEYHPNKTNYWSENAPIAIKFYPYNGCDVRQCSNCKSVFLTYTEAAGHAPEERARLVRRELIV